MTCNKTTKPIASLIDLRAAVSALPRCMQREVMSYWRRGHMSIAIAMVEAATDVRS